ncbi:PIN domain-containing protein [Betaproteobacteria bacterium]|nr:PIN domain-containing protein [Betaproteobacteria bacterium]
MGSNLTVIYDACVLYPAPLRDFLMRLALTDLYRARWTNMIHDEWTRNVLKQRPDLKAVDLGRTRSLMNAHVRDSLVTGFEHLIPSIELPDADDRHVVAAAIHGGANLIVTFNLKDFPPERLKSYSLAAQHPDDFISGLLDLHAAKVRETAARHRRSLKNPPKTADEYLDTLLKQGLTQTVDLLREWKLAL